MEKTISILTSVYNTMQDMEVKGEKNCAYVIGICNIIKQHIQELQQEQSNMQSIQNIIIGDDENDSNK